LAFYTYTLARITYHRAELVLFVINSAFPLAIMLVWMEIARAAERPIFPAGYFAGYYMIAFFVRQFNPFWLIRSIEKEVRTGSIGQVLLLPIAPLWLFLGRHLASIVMRIPILLPIFVIGMTLLGAWAEIVPWNIPAFLAALLLGMIIHFQLEYILGSLSFWRAGAVNREAIYFLLFLLAGGVLVPIELLPDGISSLFAMTPLPYILYVPVITLLQRGAPSFPLDMTGQLIWIVVLDCCRRAIWSWAIRRYEAGDV
jgi:ABC-2 type transport system permease protein